MTARCAGKSAPAAGSGDEEPSAEEIEDAATDAPTGEQTEEAAEAAGFQLPASQRETVAEEADEGKEP